MLPFKNPTPNSPFRFTKKKKKNKTTQSRGSDHEEVLAEIASLAYKSVNTDDLEQVFHSVCSKLKLPKSPSFANHLARLAAEDVLHRQTNGQWAINPELAEDIACRALARDRVRLIRPQIFLSIPWVRKAPAHDWVPFRLRFYSGEHNDFQFNVVEMEHLKRLAGAINKENSLNAFPVNMGCVVASEALEGRIELRVSGNAGLRWIETKIGAFESLLLGAHQAYHHHLLLSAMTKQAASYRRTWKPPGLEDLAELMEGKVPNKLDFDPQRLAFPIEGALLVAAYLKKGAQARAIQLLEKASFPILREALWGLVSAGITHQSHLANTVDIALKSNSPQEVWICALSLYWQGRFDELALLSEPLQSWAERYEEFGYFTAASELRALSSFPATKPSPIMKILVPAEPWKQALARLQQFTSRLESKQADQRLAWVLKRSNPAYLHIELKIQKRSKSGDWTTGRKAKLEDIALNPPEWVEERDRIVLAEYARLYATSGRYLPRTGSLLPKLAGHPRVFWSNDMTQAVEVVKETPRVVLRRDHKGIELSVKPERGAGGSKILEESPERIRISEASQQLAEVRETLGSSVMTFPLEAEEELHQMLAVLSRHDIPVESDVALLSSELEEVEPDCCLRVRLRPRGEGLSVQVRVRPLGEVGPVFRPGEGAEVVMMDALQTKRDLSEEKRLLESLEPYPELADFVLPSPLSCLEFLSDFESVSPDVARLEWPEGESFKIKQKAGRSSFHTRASKAGEWFEIDAELRLDEGKVLDFQSLWEMMSRAQGRFLPLGNGEYLALSESLQRMVERLQLQTRKLTKEGRLQLHPLAAGLALEDGEGDAAWEKQRKKLRQAREHNPSVPSSVKADLRAYQVDGFSWMSRLARWGVGACLADDMGLGKTLQALCLLLERASEGPSLVVAPTSVCANWLSECVKFTPGLRAISFAECDRAAVLSQIGSFDLVVCSYGLLVTHAEQLGKVAWNIVVLDEAQAIKNHLTKRAQAAFGLKADFRLATTGTPVENHLKELWSLFSFLNPGLLGNQTSFNKQFVGCPENLDHLRDIVRPFILRRTKTQVLAELPPRTDIDLTVELTDEEMAVYESLRRSAVERLSEEDGAIEILAELTRLRRVCCHPRLVFPDQKLEASKLKTFERLVEDLIENNHKVLVFSQFVDHLTILRELLDKKKIRYQYLDGQTSTAKRKKAVEAFQAGDGDLFLISLKAGGVGLNLTAADFVIHMDPWWNPAVEDQASDRAHRMGQQRPVTVYRLITRHTIEEKIVALHRDKREMADRLLEGADAGAKFDAKELLEVLRGAGGLG